MSLKKGDIISCNNCHKDIYELQISPKMGDLMKARYFKPVSKDILQPKSGDEFRCPLCSKLLSLDIEKEKS